PKQFLKRIERTGFGQFLFYHWRFDDDGNKREDFSLNEKKYEEASIMIAGENFGCGSSREHAQWSLLDLGFRIIVSPSFAVLFYHIRIDDDGNKREDLSITEKKYEEASIMIAGENFCCGSSREHAPWSLLDFGFRIIVATSFADIFYNNSFKNGLVPIVVDKQLVTKWQEKAEKDELNLTVDLETKKITDDEGVMVDFNIPEYHRQNLMNG